MDHFKRAWELMRDDLLAWVALGLAFTLGVSLTGGLGMLLYPNLLRVVHKAIDERAPPDLSKLIELDDIGDDVGVMLLKMIADAVGSIACGIGAIVSNILFFWAPMIAAERRYAPMEAMKASLAHAKANLGDVFAFFIVAMIVNLGGLLACCIGIVVTMPLTLVASWLFWQQSRDAVYAAAEAEGIPAKSATR